jgi:hypothetical protein
MRRAGGRGSRRAAATAAALPLALSLALWAPGAAADVTAPVLSNEVPAGRGTTSALTTSGPAPALQNAFEATLGGASAVRLDFGRMRLDPGRRIDGGLTTDSPLRLELSGPLPRTVHATLDGRAVAISRVDAGTIAVEIPAGQHQLTIGR